MAEASSDLMNYSYDPSAPLPTIKELKNHIISKGPFLFQKTRENASFWYLGTINLSGWNIQQLRIKHFVSIVECSIPRY